jgi:formylglycine-generating enzyme required for sulfatase activity
MRNSARWPARYFVVRGPVVRVAVVLRVLLNMVVLGTTMLACLTAGACSDSTNEDGAGEAGEQPIGVYQAETARRFMRQSKLPGWTDGGRNGQGLREAIHEKTGLRFVLIPSGEFKMGSTRGGVYESGFRHEEPVHRIAVAPFLLCKTECSLRAWSDGGGKLPIQQEPGPDERVEWQEPVETYWKECADWCRKAGLRLPGEEEWEYACRAGSSGAWCFGDDESLLAKYAVYGGGLVRRVGGRLPNAWGLQDMHGNAGEWCVDEFALYGGRHLPVTDYVFRVVRGGWAASRAWDCRSAWRDGEMRNEGGRHGFRPACSLAE